MLLHLCVVQLDVYTALKRMKEYTENGVPFTFSFIKYSDNTQSGGDLVTVDRAVLRKGYSKSQSKIKTLVAYTDLTNKEDRQFHYPLLQSLNNVPIEL